MRDPVPQLVRLKDYTPPAFLIPQVELDFDIGVDFTRVRSRLSLVRNPGERAAPLILDGEELSLEAVSLDGRALTADEYSADERRLVVHQPPERFVLETVSRIEPAKNTCLMGLYASKDGLFTQCEAEGFRRITWFPDRPDVMSRYQVTVHADKER